MPEVALITGAKRVGLVVAKKISGYGVHIATTYHTSEQEAKELVTAVQQLGLRAAAFPVDLSQRRQIEPLLVSIEQQLGPIDYLVAMASIFTQGSSLETTEEQLDRSLAVHLSVLWLIQGLVPRWIKRGNKGKIVVVTDRIVAAGGRPYLGHYPYYAGKAALEASVKHWAKEFMGHGITVNAVAPGATQRPREINEKDWQELRLGILPGSSDDQMAEQVAETVRFFLGTNFITGQTIVVDAGQNLL